MGFIPECICNDTKHPHPDCPVHGAMAQREMDAAGKAVEGNETWPAPELISSLPETEIDDVTFPNEGGVVSRGVGGRQAKRIYLSPTGNGPNGSYDQIHIIMNTGEHIIANAHQVEGWNVLEPEPYVLDVDVDAKDSPI